MTRPKKSQAAEKTRSIDASRFATEPGASFPNDDTVIDPHLLPVSELRRPLAEHRAIPDGHARHVDQGSDNSPHEQCRQGSYESSHPGLAVEWPVARAPFLACESMMLNKSAEQRKTERHDREVYQVRGRPGEADVTPEVHDPGSKGAGERELRSQRC